MRVGLWIALTLFALGALVARVRAQEPPTGAEVTQIVQKQPEVTDLRIEQMQTERLPDTFRAKILIWCVSCSFMSAFVAYLSRRLDWQKVPPTVSCGHCQGVHRISGIFALCCDAITSSSFFYLLALPFMAAMRAQAFDIASIGASVLLGTALIMVLILIGSVVSLLNINKASRKTAGSGFLIGLRLSACLVSLALLSGGPTPDAISATFDSIFGMPLSQRLINDIGAVPILETSVVLSSTVALSFLLRWVFPFIAGSRPLFFTRSGEPAHKPIQLARQ
jgi:hypothetical protein